MYPFPVFHMIGAGYVFAAVLLIAAMILCTAITVTASLISNKKIKAETEKEMTKPDIVTDNPTNQGE